MAMMRTVIPMITDAAALLRLQSWLSPAFPIGAFSYSHALEWAVEAGDVRDRATLADWLEADLRHGAGRNDAIFFTEAWRAVQANDSEEFLKTAELAAAYRGSAEFALEASAQGAAFVKAVRAAWPSERFEALADDLARAGTPWTLPIAAGAACASHRIELDAALALYLQSTVANLVNAGVRLIPLGQTEGQIAVAALEAAVLAVTWDAVQLSLDDLGSAAVMVDIASMQHETQYTRLFRS